MGLGKLGNPISRIEASGTNSVAKTVRNRLKDLGLLREERYISADGSAGAAGRTPYGQ